MKTLSKLGVARANLRLFTGNRDAVSRLWETSVAVDRAVIFPPAEIPMLEASTYTYADLERATNGFVHRPAVVRGLFRESGALERWASPDYLPEGPLGCYDMPVISDATYGSKQQEWEMRTFADVFRDIVERRASKYLFFPTQSRLPGAGGTSTREGRTLQQTVDELVARDLDLDRILPGFADPERGRLRHAQMIIGYGGDTPETVTGTGWHCAFAGNFFVQVAGRKRWYFMSPEASRFVHPLRNGVNSMMAGHASMAEVQQHLPTSFVDLEPGDMLYVPHWVWHTVKNYAGLSIGVPLREFDLRLALRNNRHYSLVALVNNLSIGLLKRDIGGYGPGTLKA